MNIAQIKAAVDAGMTVHWANEGYLVHKDILGPYLITYQLNGSTIGLKDRPGERLNGDEKDFLVSRPDLGVTIHCGGCGSEDVLRDCWATWNAELQVWESADLQDHAWCNICDDEAKLVERAIREYVSGSGCADNELYPAIEQGRVEHVEAETIHPSDGQG